MIYEQKPMYKAWLFFCHACWNLKPSFSLDRKWKQAEKMAELSAGVAGGMKEEEEVVL